jgi:uncharacterized protein YwgA
MNRDLPIFVKALANRGLVSLDIVGDSEENFDNRLKLQKYVFLAKRYGLDLGYNHSMYLRGPYSSRLTDDYYELAKSNVVNTFNGSFPTGFDERGFFNLVNNKDLEWLEAAATLLSLRESFNDKTCLLERTKNMKDHISGEKIELTLIELEKHGLISF